MDKELVLKWILGPLSLFYILTGLLIITSKEMAVLISQFFFSFQLDITSQVYWILNPFARYWVIFGMFLALAASDPRKYRIIIYIAVTNFLIRVFQRIAFLFTAPENLTLQGSFLRGILLIMVLISISITLLLLTRRLK